MIDNPNVFDKKQYHAIVLNNGLIARFPFDEIELIGEFVVVFRLGEKFYFNVRAEDILARYSITEEEYLYYKQSKSDISWYDLKGQK